MDNTGMVVLIIIAAVFVAPYIYMRVSAARAVGKPAPAVARINGKETETRQSLYLYFMSKNCSMCKKMTPLIEQLQLTIPGLAMVDIDQSPELARDFYVYGTPTLMVVKDSHIIKVKLGKLSDQKIRQFFDG